MRGARGRGGEGDGTGLSRHKARARPLLARPHAPLCAQMRVPSWHRHLNLLSQRAHTQRACRLRIQWRPLGQPHLLWRLCLLPRPRREKWFAAYLVVHDHAAHNICEGRLSRGAQDGNDGVSISLSGSVTTG